MAAKNNSKKKNKTKKSDKPKKGDKSKKKNGVSKDKKTEKKMSNKQKQTKNKKSTGKTNKKTTISKKERTEVIKEASSNEDETTKKVKVQGGSVIVKTGMKVLGWILLVVVPFIAVDFLVQYLNNDFSIAVVNGSRISTSEYHERLETAFGEKIAQDLIDEELIRQEAQKEGITVTSKDVDKRLNEITERIGGDEALEEALMANNITKDELRKQVKNDLLTEGILEPTIEYSEEEVKQFFEQYKSIIYPEAEVSFEEKEEEVKDMFLSQKVGEKKIEWLEELRMKATVQNNNADKPGYGFLRVTRNIISNIQQERGN